jgi:hypothetical protein
MPTLAETRFTYAVLISNQEEPELMPNEVAYRFAQLTGEDHYTVHLALASLNPELHGTDEGDFTLSLPDVAALAAQVALLHE